jgi:hypothetical protein
MVKNVRARMVIEKDVTECTNNHFSVPFISLGKTTPKSQLLARDTLESVVAKSLEFWV